jgi:epoxide hydrolase-like predicted phosphatase
MIKAFLFDYDGVITKGVDNEWVAERLARNIDVPLETASAWMKEIWPAFLRGTITEDEIWEQIEAKHGKKIDASQRDVWFVWDEVKPLPEMIDFVHSLKADGYLVGVLSNVFAVTKKVVEANGGYDAFDLVVTSCDLGFKKPDPDIFQVAMQRLGDIKPEETVFLDDREANAKAAEEHGFTGIYVTSQQDAVRDVKALIGK